MNPAPIDNALPGLVEAVLARPAVILHAPPGAGKTTRVPLALLDTVPPIAGRIVMLEPRRIAAVSAARWMAHLLGEEVGRTVGYTIRFDRAVSAATRIEVVTEGILTRRLQADPGLEGTALVIFDEFHERSLHADLALALCLDVRKGLRPDLKLLVMSATLDTGPLAALLGGAPVVAAEGQSFPVEERYLGRGAGALGGRVASAVRTALRETNGDVLVFLPGAGEIRFCARELQESLDLHEERLSLHPLFGDLPFAEQERAIVPSPDRRKIVLATNIAETSLTIQGVRVVIDSGLTRMLRYDPATGMNRLVTVPVSRASAEQRKGRAGRLGPGACYRLYDSQEYRSLVPFSQPEIIVSDLAQTALELAAWGVTDPRALSWLDPPPAAAWESARGLLRGLGALDPAGFITPLGREMVRLPLHPRLSRLQLRSVELGRPRQGADLAALLTERDIFRRGAEQRPAGDPDIALRLEALGRARAGKAPAVADPPALRAVERTANQLLRLLPEEGGAGRGGAPDSAMTARLLLAAFPDRVCKRRDEPGQGFVHSQGRGVRISPESPLVNSPFLIAVQADAGAGSEGYVHLAAAVTEDLVRSECAGRISGIRRVEWDRKEARIVAVREERLDAIVLASRPFAPTDEEAAPLLCEAVRTTPGLVVFSREASQYRAREALLRRAFPEESWPDLSDGRLLGRPEEWLLPWLGGLRSADDLRRLNVLPALKAALTREQQRQMDVRAPVAIEVPSGSRISLDYAAGDQPVLAVKLQELFGLADTPRVAGGRLPVLLHLLSPARRPVQVTQDLRNFWNAVYPEVKKDLKGRYPRHPWPDDPWNAAPTRRTKPR